MNFVSRFVEFPQDQSFFLFGPRGTGKSMLLKERYKSHWRIDLLKPEMVALYATNPRLLEEEWRGRGHPSVVIIDEIQRVPVLLDIVHELLESSNRPRQFILTGSSSRKLKRAGVNLLGGRALKKTLHPFMPAELGTLFSLEVGLSQGLLPLIWTAKDPLTQLGSYKGMYLVEEVQQEGLVRDISPFARFIEAISFSQGAVLDITNVATECRVPRKTVANYVQVLRDLLLAFDVPIFSKRPKRKLVTRSKFYFFDCGVYRAIRPKGPLAGGDIEGPALEGLVGQSLRAWCEYRNQEYAEQNELYYWRTSDGVEVDFIVYGTNAFVAFEVKNSSNIRPKDLKGLKTFKTDYDIAECIVLYCGQNIFLKGGVTCLPVELFLKKLKPSSSLKEVIELAVEACDSR